MASAASLVVLVVAAGVVSSLAQAVILAGLLPAVLASASAFPASAQWVADPACSHELTCSLEYALLHAQENGINK